MLLLLALIPGTSIFRSRFFVAYDMPPGPPGGAGMLAIIPFHLCGLCVCHRSDIPLDPKTKMKVQS